ncbi:MAG: hypothetical protein ACE5JA_03860 [bacterium]
MQSEKERSPGRFGLFILLLCLLLSVIFFQAARWSTGGRPTFPTDDTYIYFQYARQLVSGHPFEYNTGDTRTTGVTSYLYWFLISFGYLAGFRGPFLFHFAFFIGFVGLVTSAWLTYRIMDSLLGSEAGVAAAVLFCLNGQIVWGYLAGLEIPLFASLLLLSIFFFLRDLQRGTYLGTMVACSLLAISRPAGLVVGCSLALLLALAGGLRPGIENRGARKGSLWVLLPLSVSVAYLAVNKLIAGHATPTSASTKSLWLTLDILSIIRVASHFVLDSMRGIFGASYPSSAEIGFSGYSSVAYFAPLALFFFLLGSFPRAARELRNREVSGFTVLLSVFILGLGFVAFGSSSGWQHHRYLIPFYPMFIMCMVAGVFSFSSSLGPKLGERSLKTGILAFFMVLSLVGLGSALGAYSFEAEMIRSTTVEVAEWVNTNLAQDDRLGLIDAGALRYFGGRRTVDLLGLTTARFYGRYRRGWGAAVEELGHMREDERPTHLAMMPIFASRTLGVEPLFQVFSEKVYSPPPMYSTGQTIYRADYTALDEGRLPNSAAEDWTMVDSLDVGYIGDELRCDYSLLDSRPGVHLHVGLYVATYGDGQEIADGGRVVLTGERFTISTMAKRALRIVVRSASAFTTYRSSPIGNGYITSTVPLFNPLVVYVNGQRLEGAGIETREGDRWHETVLEIPSGLIVSERTTIELIGTYNSFHYWFFQK